MNYKYGTSKSCRTSLKKSAYDVQGKERQPKYSKIGSRFLLCLKFASSYWLSTIMNNSVKFIFPYWCEVIFYYDQATRATYEAVSSIEGLKIKHIQASP